MQIIYIEPFYSGAHKQWIDSYKEKSSHDVDILTLPGNKWKWRMHGGAITLANEFMKYKKKIDLIICSDFLNLPVFKAICKNQIIDIPIIMYFHENQLSYPWSPHDSDISLNRDLHYHFINYTSSLVSDFNLFNSKYHLDSYLDSLKKYLKKMPDYNNFKTIDVISNKSDILYIGCDLKKFINYKNKKKNDCPLILWNHRWEFDKNPELFFKTLFKLKSKNIKFEVAVLGEKFKEYPKVFDEAKKILGKNIIHFGFCKSFDEYSKWLCKADILPVTSKQDFFGISIVEAVSVGLYPMLPERLSYPEIFDQKNNPEIFYQSDVELYNKLYSYLNSYKKLRKSTSKYEKLIDRFDWSNMVKVYDKTFEKYYKN